MSASKQGASKQASKQFYAGIGSRQTPPDVALFMTEIAHTLRAAGLILRSGRGGNADEAFEEGAGAYAEIFKPWSSFAEGAPSYGALCYASPTLEAIALASRFHPAWDRCSKADRALHGRNAHVILGRFLDAPVGSVICWTPEGSVTGESLRGGTNHALRIAHANGIRVVNLRLPEHYKQMVRKMWATNDEPVAP